MQANADAAGVWASNRFGLGQKPDDAPPAGLREPSADLQARVTQMYDADPGLHALWQSALDTRRMAEPGARQDPASLGKLAAGFLRRSDGPRLAMLETSGWDTHAGQVGRMNSQLKNLDALLAALREGLGDTWQHTTVLVATEFGRTAAVNGTGGTDHGTASVAMLVGGAVKAGRQGGRVLADWPGLAPQQLLEGRDLRATMQLDAVIAAAASQTLNLPPDRVSRAVFPQMGRVTLPEGLAAVSPPVRACGTRHSCGAVHG